MPAWQQREHTVNAVRRYEAPRERVFECWTRAAHLAHWFGPAGFSIHSCEADARPDGVFRLCMRSPEGRDYWVRGSYLEVIAPERLVIRCFADDARGVQRLEETITVHLVEEGGATRLTLHATAGGAGPEAAAMLEGMEQGW
ncbi:MAG: SRPBCC family protein, partial [Burkholderiales bacterium]